MGGERGRGGQEAGHDGGRKRRGKGRKREKESIKAGGGEERRPT